MGNRQVKIAENSEFGQGYHSAVQCNIWICTTSLGPINIDSSVEARLAVEFHQSRSILPHQLLKHTISDHLILNLREQPSQGNHLACSLPKSVEQTEL